MSVWPLMGMLERPVKLHALNIPAGLVIHQRQVEEMMHSPGKDICCFLPWVCLHQEWPSTFAIGGH